MRSLLSLSMEDLIDAAAAAETDGYGDLLHGHVGRVELPYAAAHLGVDLAVLLRGLSGVGFAAHPREGAADLPPRVGISVGVNEEVLENLAG